jgi:NAD(P)-dependent dehydrogenase (short-subunit alcohol dehydrogenase family)
MAIDLKNKRILITGAGSGIGRACARTFAREGAELWLTDVQRAGLDETARSCREAGASVQARVVDVSDAVAMTALADEVHGQGGALDVLMNNAGVGVAGKLVETDFADWDWALSINVKGVVHGCRLFGPAMIVRGQGGHIVNVASAAGLLAPPGMSIYAATKFAVVGLSESLRAELLPHGVVVTTLCPGVVDTPIVQNTRLTGSLAQKQGFTERMVKAYRRRGYGPERVAAVVRDAVKARRGGVLPVTPEAWGMYLVKRLAPDLTGLVSSRSNVI